MTINGAPKCRSCRHSELQEAHVTQSHEKVLRVRLYQDGRRYT